MEELQEEGAGVRAHARTSRCQDEEGGKQGGHPGG